MAVYKEKMRLVALKVSRIILTFFSFEKDTVFIINGIYKAWYSRQVRINCQIRRS